MPEGAEPGLFSPEVAANPQPAYKSARAHCPVARGPLNGGPILLRYDDVLYALRHPEIFSSSFDAVITLGNDRPMIPLQIDPPDQLRYRRLLDPLFSRKRMMELEPEVRRLANELIDDFIEDGECEFDRAFAIPFPCTVFLRLLGLPVEELDLLLELKDGIIRPAARDLEQADRIRVEMGKRIYARFDSALDERVRERRDDLLSHLIDAEVDGERLSRSEMLDICYLFLLGGLDTVTASLGCFMAYLAQHPEQRRRLVDDPALIPSAVEELLRWETPVIMVVRLVKQDVTIGGEQLKAGEVVTLLLGSADTDEDEFPDPDRVDFERGNNRHLAFSGGPHRCLGSHLARMELRVALEALHARIPDYAIKAGEQPRYSPAIREVQYLPLVFEPGSGAP